jgi:hypothetical protein
VVFEILVAAFVSAVNVVKASCKRIRWDLAGVRIVKMLVENSFQAVRAVNAVQARFLVGPWDMAGAIPMKYESVGEGIHRLRK